MSDPTTPPPNPPNTYRRRCRRCGQEVIEAVTVFRGVARFDPHPSPAGCFRFDPDGTAVAVGPDDVLPGQPLYQSHAQSCAVPATDRTTGGEG